MDHDQRFKILLQEFFLEFMQLFFPALAERFDFTRITWLDKEVFADPPQGTLGRVDLVAQLPVRQPVPAQRTGESDAAIALIHVEIEGADSVQPLRSRIYEYYEQLRRRHRKPVLPIGLFLRVGLEGIGVDVYEEYLWEHRIIHFEYLYVGLPALDAESYLGGSNWLGVALSSLMRMPRERGPLLAAEGLRRLVQCPENEWRRFLLGNCLVAYAAADEDQKRELNQLLTTEPYREVLPMTKTWYDEGVELGENRGFQRGQRQLIKMLLEDRFGPLSASAEDRLAAWPADKLEDLGRALLSAQSLREVGLEDAPGSADAP